MRVRKKRWLAPILIVLLALGSLLAIAEVPRSHPSSTASFSSFPRLHSILGLRQETALRDGTERSLGIYLTQPLVDGVLIG